MTHHTDAATTEGRFPSTRWTLIARLRSPDDATARRALDDLCAQYRYPLYCYIRRRGFSHHDAEDALQDFLVKLLRLDTFAGAEESRGHLRSLLATALQRFLASWLRDRPHRAREISVDPLPDDGRDDEGRYQHEHFTERDTPEVLFERKWSHALVTGALARLRERYEAAGKIALFTALQPVLIAGGSLRGEDAPALAASLGTTAGALRVALSRLLRDYRAAIEDEVAATVETPRAVAEELAHLLAIIRSR
jgi:DNA-directed RNA polymerase specialized sigma24 family protein